MKIPFLISVLVYGALGHLAVHPLVPVVPIALGALPPPVAIVQLASVASNQLPIWSSHQHGSVPAQSQLGRFVQSLTATEGVGTRGPLTLKDTNFIEHMAHFDRERIPERVVHAKGCGAHGYFQVTHDISRYSKACIFEPGSVTRILIRFSTVGGETGSADTAHDPRGFAIKFYTKCGIWDLVGNNLETFPIRDPILFPSLIRSRKRNPETNLGDPNMWWDFTSLRPESTFHTLQLFSYLGYPDGVRFMDGAGVHTFKLVNESGQAIYCKFHHISLNGYKNTTAKEAKRLTGENPNYSTEDLYNAIAQGDYPSWKMHIQVMTFEDAEKVPFHPFDITKVWPRDLFPLIPVGNIVLNQNPKNFFSEIEMAAFDPGNMIPGIEQSPDRMLQGRSFSYSDTQRYRLGANFLQLPINRPEFFPTIHTYQRDGQCNLQNNEGTPNYFPNSFNGPVVLNELHEHVDQTAGDIVRRDTGDEDNFSQPRLWYLSRTDAEKNAIARNIAMALKPVHPPVRDRAIRNFWQVDSKLKDDICTHLGIIL